MTNVVVILKGKYANEPAVVIDSTKRTLTVLLSRTGEQVTVRRSSVEFYA